MNDLSLVFRKLKERVFHSENKNYCRIYQSRCFPLRARIRDLVRRMKIIIGCQNQSKIGLQFLFLHIRECIAYWIFSHIILTILIMAYNNNKA